MRHLHVPDRPDEPTPEHSVRPNPDRPDRQCKCGRLAPSRSTFSNEIDGGAVDLVRGSRPRRVSPVRTATDLDAEVDRSRHGLRPISRRSTTGPMAERGGFEPPVRQAHSGFQDRHIRPLCHLSMPDNHSNHSMLVRATRHYHHRPGAQRHCPCPRGQAASTASAESTASAAPTGVTRGRRTPACESVWPTPAPARRACPDVPPPKPAPSPATRADGA